MPQRIVDEGTHEALAGFPEGVLLNAVIIWKLTLAGRSKRVEAAWY